MSMQDYEKVMEKPKVKLSGTDGNAFAVLGKVSTALRRHGHMTSDEIEEFMADAMSGDYDHLLRVCMDYVDVE